MEGPHRMGIGLVVDNGARILLDPDSLDRSALGWSLAELSSGRDAGVPALDDEFEVVVAEDWMIYAEANARARDRRSAFHEITQDYVKTYYHPSRPLTLGITQRGSARTLFVIGVTLDDLAPLAGLPNRRNRDAAQNDLVHSALRELKPVEQNLLTSQFDNVRPWENNSSKGYRGKIKRWRWRESCRARRDPCVTRFDREAISRGRGFDCRCRSAFVERALRGALLVVVPEKEGEKGGGGGSRTRVPWAFTQGFYMLSFSFDLARGSRKSALTAGPATGEHTVRAPDAPAWTMPAGRRLAA